MKYIIEETEPDYGKGKYFKSLRDELYQIIYDEDRGYALLNVEEGRVDSEFNGSKEELLLYTNLKEMKPLKQIGEAIFKEV